MKIVFAKIHDATRDLYLTSLQYPVNIAYLAQVCIDAGYEVEMWDFCLEEFSEEYLIDKLSKSKPDILGLSCVTSAVINGHKLASIAKNVNSDILTIVGGVHVTALPEQTLNEFPNFDLGVLTEGEDIILEVCAAYEKKVFPKNIPGTIYRENGEIVRPPARTDYPDVNLIPYPNRDLIPLENYGAKHTIRGVSRDVWRVIEVDSSRGCPYACTFCNVELTHGRKTRFRTPDNILGEIEQCVKTFDTNFVVFNDSTFTIRKDRVQEIVKALPGIGIEGYSVNAHVNTVDEEMLRTLKDTGCYKVMYGVESGSDRVLREVKKNSTQDRIRKAINLSKKVGIPQVETTFIIGADIHETEEDVQQTENLICELSPDILGLGIITPFPGTDQYVQMKQLGLFEDVTWDDFLIFCETPPPWRTANFSAEELVEVRNRILKKYIWSPQYVLQKLRKVRSWAELAYYATMAKSFYKVVIRHAQ
ncbi:MAG: radical SAM protein [Pseudomonadota bacterium]|nr:radical SAM protein [Pseudomonadota bacterium]